MASTSFKPYRALKPPTAALEVAEESTICMDYVRGLCQSPSCTPAAHRLCRIRKVSADSTLDLPTGKNTLSSAKGSKDFENDGPGQVSLQGPRNDNDHKDINEIKILPTVDEMLSGRMPYMPRKAKFAFHHYSDNAVKRYIDTQFRQLRHDSIAAVMDACLAGFRLATHISPVQHDFRQETSDGAKFHWFENVKIEMALFNDRNGAMFQLSYPCPTAFQGPRKMLSAPFLKEGMLCALLAVHEETRELNVIFLQVHQAQSTEVMRSKTGSHHRAAVQVILADPDDGAKVSQLAYYLRGQVHAKMFLVDMPSVLVASFLSHLKVLQNLFIDGEFAFKEYITASDPKTHIKTDQGVCLPAPMGIVKDTQFNLNCLKKNNVDRSDLTMTALSLNVHPNKDQELLDIKERSTLDDGQAVALFESLTRELAFTQGPPGTGKTYLGVALVDTILKSRITFKKNPPIVVVCQTNHALDDFLEELIQRGMTKITRIGGGSTAKWIGPYLLKNQRSKRQPSSKESSLAGRIKQQMEFQYQLGSDFAEALNENLCVPWILIRSYLSVHHMEIYKHFAALDIASVQKSMHDLRSARMRHGFAFMFWQEGGDIEDANGLINAFENLLGQSQLVTKWTESEIARLKEEVAQGFKAGIDMALSDGGCRHLWALSQESRRQLACRWLEESDPGAACEAFSELHRRFHHVKARRSAAYDERDLNVIMDSGIEIIGMTSTACATMRPLLQKIAPQVMVFEEASELLEVHSTIALVPSVKHCIQIGDPLQLRPLIEQKVLSVERNESYRLDESLFERFMKAEMPFAQLNTQRRAHPQIADLLRVGDYPYLVDHPKTLQRSRVAGMEARLWWMDHKHPEDSIDPLSAFSKSASNQFEVKFVTALVRYLIEKQHYKWREITVLTPYKGQLAALQQDLSQICSVSLTEDDRNELIDEALIEDREFTDGTCLDVALSDMLRIATIDNYQGEQARVIIFSAVRSNTKDSIGFLANHNRTNVAISRAEDGFFVFGNASLMEQSEHWAKIIHSFRSKNAIGPFIKAQCHQHPNKTWAVSQPAEFQQVSCTEVCNQTLPCGHTCKSPCHLPEMHHDGRMPCSEPCTKIRDCGHGCDRLCSQRCGPCTAPIESVSLDCGHMATLTCGQKLEDVVCKAIFDTIKLDCGHEQTILCSESSDSTPRLCSEPCATKLPCGHLCHAKCSECSDGNHAKKCKDTCGRSLDCGHLCQEPCHIGDCPPCQQPCEKYCQHGRCNHACHQPCKVCIDPVTVRACPHKEFATTTKICCLPDLLLPCSKPCEKLLPCAVHTCPSLCGEPCPNECKQCLQEGENAGLMIALSCGHLLPVQQLDEAFGMHNNCEFNSEGEISKFAITQIVPQRDLCCPVCTATISRTRRYALIDALPSLSNTIDRLTSFCAKKLLQSYRDIDIGERIVFARLSDFLGNLKTGPMSVTGNQYAITERCHRLIDAQQTASQHARKCITQIEQSITDTCKALNNQDMFPTPSFAFGLRCDLLYFWSRLTMIEYAYRIATYFARSSGTDLQNRLLAQGYTSHAIAQAAGECIAIEEKIAACELKNLKRLEAEMRIIQLCYWNILRAQKSTSKVDLDVSASLARIQHLTDCYPQSAGLFSAGYQIIRSSIGQNAYPPRFYSLCSERTNDMWHRFGDYKPGDLQLCHYNHIYSAAAFPAGCPECGLEVPHVAPESYDQENVIPRWKGDLEPIDVNAFAAQVRAVAFTIHT